MSYRRRGSSSNYVVVRKQGRHPVRVVAETHHRLKRIAEKEANSMNKNFKGTNIKFVVRKEGWNRKNWSS